MNALETWQTEPIEESTDRVQPLPEIAHVRVLTGPSRHLVHTFASRTGTSIGAVGGGCELSIGDRRISRKHARIERGATGWQLQDLGARNRGWVDGRGYGTGARIPLADGAVIRLGETVLVFRASPPTTDGQADCPAFPGVSPVAIAVRRRISALATGTGHVLIVGETGAGKERIARAIGERRAAHPFVTLNSAELSRDLARAELFGYRRGSFTNANDHKLGLVDAAGEGVLFFDEIGELWIDVQPDLLRFLEDGSYRPIGATELRHSAARVVAATHVDLDHAVQTNKFRRDLLARLRASNPPLAVPPLRDRREDIPGWADRFLSERGYPSVPDAWTAGALECLLLYPWSENLRQLRGVIAEVAERAQAFPFGTEHLPALLCAHRAMLRGPGPTAIASGTSAHAQQEVLLDDSPTPANDPSKEEIEEMLRVTQGNRRAAALRLGIERTKLYRLCKAFGIALEAYRAETNREDE